MWSDADKLNLLNATPRILSEISRVMSGSGGGRVFKFPRLLSRKKYFLGLRVVTGSKAPDIKPWFHVKTKLF